MKEDQKTEREATGNENTELLELLRKISRENEEQKAYVRRQVFYSRLSVILLAVFVGMLTAALAFTLPRLYGTLDTAVLTMNHADAAIADVSRELETLDEVFGNVNGLIDNTEASLTLAMDKINKMDVESLNQAIKELQDVVEPLARLFRKFE